MNVTKDVIDDLWPLYTDGTASADSRKLVEEYLRDHPEWAKKLREGTTGFAWPSTPPIPPDEDTRMLNRIKKRMRNLRILLIVSISLTAQAFGRIVADTSWDVSPLAFIVTSACAAVCWIWWGVLNWRVRRLGP